MRQDGFTLVEILVVLVIVAVLTAVALPYYFHAVESARMTEIVTLWGRQKEMARGYDFSPEQASRLSKKLAQVKLNYFTARIVCREKENPTEICWEAEFAQKNEQAHTRYQLVTVQNFTQLACVALNKAGEDFCTTQALDENNSILLDGKKAFIIR